MREQTGPIAQVLRRIRDSLLIVLERSCSSDTYPRPTSCLEFVSSVADSEGSMEGSASCLHQRMLVFVLFLLHHNLANCGCCGAWRTQTSNAFPLVDEGRFVGSWWRQRENKQTDGASVSHNLQSLQLVQRAVDAADHYETLLTFHANTSATITISVRCSSKELHPLSCDISRFGFVCLSPDERLVNHRSVMSLRLPRERHVGQEGTKTLRTELLRMNC